MAVGLHCCAASEDRAVLLACLSARPDRIQEVAFAAFGAPAGAAVCGQEVVPACGADVREQVAAQCVGRARCKVNVAKLGGPCPLAEGQRVLTVRWTCLSDAGPLPGDGTAGHLPPLPLRANGSAIVDSEGRRVRLRGVNWPGAHQWNHVPTGLAQAPLRSLARLVRQLGFNLVRLTFALETFRLNPVIGDHSVAANPELRGLRALEVLDRVVDSLGREGVMVWLDNHMLDADWCCNDRDCNGLWFNGRHSADEWVEMWGEVGARYARFPAVVGAGLKNEPRKVCNGKRQGKGYECSVAFQSAQADADGCIEAQWATGPEHLRYRDAVERAGQSVLKANPRLLVSVCGLSYGTILTEAAASPPRLPRSNVVYEAHEYSWFHKGRVLEGQNGHKCKLDSNWGYLARDGVAPVLVSELGMSHKWEANIDTRRWFELVTKYVRGRDLDWAYWQLGGVQLAGTSRAAGNQETFGVLNQCWTGPANVSHLKAIQRLMHVPGPGARAALSGSCIFPDSVSPGTRIPSGSCAVFLAALAALLAWLG